MPTFANDPFAARPAVGMMPSSGGSPLTDPLFKQQPAGGGNGASSSSSTAAVPSDFALTEIEVDSLQKVRREVADLLPVLDRMENCGFACQEQRNRIAELDAQAAMILQQFGPRPGF